MLEKTRGFRRIDAGEVAMVLAFDKTRAHHSFGLDASIGIRVWSMMEAVDPLEAARFLMMEDPFDERTRTPEVSKLLRLFEREHRRVPRHRSMRDWLEVARAKDAPRSYEIALCVEHLSNQQANKAAKPWSRRGLVVHLISHWPTIESDLDNASRNGLSSTARLAPRGWNKDAALQWAKARGRLSKTVRAKQV